MSLKAKLAPYYRKLKYSGYTYECPLCHFKARSFISAGLYVKRIDSKCPSCQSLERHRHMWLFLSEYLKNKNVETILHFAPENCLGSLLKKRRDLKYFTSDYDSKAPSDYHFDIQDIESKDNSFDLVICSHVLEHIPDDKKALREIYRILNPGGIALLQVPIWPSEAHGTYENPSITDPRDRIIHFGQFDHLRIYGLDFKERVLEAGFTVTMLDMEKEVPDQMAYKYRLHNNSGIRELTFVCKKY